ncbi:MAG: hypothetical protein ACPGAJ_09120, partial [Schleiferiaceae bacterium]
ATTQSITVSPTSTTTYTLTGTDANGCENTDQVTVTVEDLPSVSVSSGSSTLCSGETVTLSSTVAGGSWSSSDNSVATVSGGVVTAKSVSVQSTAVITFTSTANCTGSITVTVNPELTISGTLSATVGGSAPTLLINGSTTASASSWSSSDQNVATVDATTAGKIVPVAAGTTTITYTDPTTSCQATATFTVSAAP